MIQIGVVGTGGMANGHAQAFGSMKGVVVTACCDVNLERAKVFAKRHGIPKVFDDYGVMLRETELDAITNVTTDAAHAPVSIAALKRGLHVLCEKPMATTLAEARSMLRAATASKRIHMIHFSKRNSAGLEAAARTIRKGGIGRVLHVEASYLQSWLVHTRWGDWRIHPAMTWRLSTRHGSAGVLGDLGCHIYDMAAFLCGPIEEIDCRLATFPKGVKGERVGQYTLDANDSFVSTVRFAGGALGTVSASRWASGHVNREYVAVFGDKGAVEVDFERDLDVFRVATAESPKRADWKEIRLKPVPTLYARFVRAIRSGRQDVCNFSNGLRVQAYLDASFRSDSERRPVRVPAKLTSKGR